MISNSRILRSHRPSRFARAAAQAFGTLLILWTTAAFTLAMVAAYQSLGFGHHCEPCRLPHCPDPAAHQSRTNTPPKRMLDNDREHIRSILKRKFRQQ